MLQNSPRARSLALSVFVACHVAAATIDVFAAEPNVVVVSSSEQLQLAFAQRGTVVLQPGAVYTITPPLIVNGVLDCRGAKIEAASAGTRAVTDPTSTLIECLDSTILNGSLDCRGLVNSGVFSRGKLRLLDVSITDYRRKGVHCVHGQDNKPVESIIVDGLVARSQRLDPTRTGPAFQYDSSQPCKLVFLNNITAGPHGTTPRPTSVFKIANVERLYADRIDAGGSKIVFGEDVGEATVRVRNLYYEKGGRGIDFHPDPAWNGLKRPQKLTIIEDTDRRDAPTN